MFSIKTADDSPRLPKLEPEIRRDAPLKCRGFQGLVCLASNDLPLEQQECVYARKYTLQNHVDRCRLDQYGPDDQIPCPDDHACAGVVLNGKIDFKAHAPRVYSSFLWLLSLFISSLFPLPFEQSVQSQLLSTHRKTKHSGQAYLNHIIISKCSDIMKYLQDG